LLHLDHFIVPVRGRTLNALIVAAHEALFEKCQPADKRPLPDTTRLAQAVLAEFQDLLRECHCRTGLVPIHEVRQRIAAQFGPSAARHDVLDEVILGQRLHEQVLDALPPQVGGRRCLR
jgi:hypothetical protein